MASNPLESPIRKINTISQFAKEVQIGSEYLLKPQTYLNKFIDSNAETKLLLAQEFLNAILKPNIIKLKFKESQTPTGLKSPRTDDIQLKVNNIYFIDGKQRLVGFLIFQTLMRLNLKFESIENLIPINYRHWSFLLCWELSECQDLPTELFTQTDPYHYFINLEEIPPYNRPKTWFYRYAIRTYFTNSNISEFTSRLYGNVVYLIREVSNCVIEMKDPNKFEQTLEHQVDWVHFGIDLVKALLTHNEIRECSRVGPHLEDHVVENNLQDKIRWKELKNINDTVDKLLNQNVNFSWTSDLFSLHSDLDFSKFELKEKIQFLLDEKKLPNPLFNHLLLDGIRSDCFQLKYFDLGILFHVYFTLIQSSLEESQWYYELDTGVVAKLYDVISIQQLSPSLYLAPALNYIFQNWTITSITNPELFTIQLIETKLAQLDSFLSQTILPNLNQVKQILNQVNNQGIQCYNNISIVMKFLQDPRTNASYLSHITEKNRIPFLFDSGKEAYQTEQYFESSEIFTKLIDYLENLMSSNDYQLIIKLTKKYSRLSWIKYYFKMGLTIEDLPEFMLDPNSLLYLHVDAVDGSLIEGLKWSDQELIELSQFYCHLNQWNAAEQLINRISKYIKIRTDKPVSHNFPSVAQFQLEQFFILLGHGVKIYKGFLSVFNKDQPGTICQWMSYKDSVRVVDYPDTFIEMRNSLIKIINIVKNNRKNYAQSDQKTLLTLFFKDIYSNPFPWFLINLISGWLIHQPGFLKEKPIEDFGFGSILACSLNYPDVDKLHVKKVIELLQEPKVINMSLLTESEIYEFWRPSWLQLITPILRFGEDHEIPKFIQLQLVRWLPDPPQDLPVEEFFIEWLLTQKDQESDKEFKSTIREKISAQISIYTRVIERCVPKLGKIAIAIMSQFMTPHHPYSMALKFVDQAKFKKDEISLIWLLFDYEIARCLCERFRTLDTPTYDLLFKRLNALEFTPMQPTPNEKDPRRYEAWKDAYEFSFWQFWRLIDIKVYYDH